MKKIFFTIILLLLILSEVKGQFNGENIGFGKNGFGTPSFIIIGFDGLGTSITAGTGTSDTTKTFLTILSNTWGVSHVNYGKPGDTTGGMLIRFSNDPLPRVNWGLLFEGAVNDLSYEHTAMNPNIVHNIDSIMKLAVSRKMKIFSIGCLPWTNGTTTDMNRRDSINAIWKNLTINNYGGYWLGDSVDNAIGTKRSGVLPDSNLWNIQIMYVYGDGLGVHYNDTGHTRIALGILRGMRGFGLRIQYDTTRTYISALSINDTTSGIDTVHVYSQLWEDSCYAYYKVNSKNWKEQKGIIGSNHSYTFSHPDSTSVGDTLHVRVLARGNTFCEIDTTFIINHLRPASYDIDAIALFNRMSITPPDSLKGFINNLIVGYKNRTLDGKGITLWAGMDDFGWVLHDSSDSKLNWKSSSYTIVNHGTVWNGAYKGWTTNGSTSYLNLIFNPASNGVNYTLNDCGFGCYLAKDTVGGFDMGIDANSASTYFSANFDNSTTKYFSLNTNGGDIIVFSNLSTLGEYYCIRTSSHLSLFYRRNSLIGTRATVSYSLPPAAFYMGGDDNSGVLYFAAARKYLGWWMGCSLSANDIAYKDSVDNAYLSAIGSKPY